LEIRGHSKRDIAKMLNMSEGRVVMISRADRYIEARDREFRSMDNEFISMKPAAFDALSNALHSRDQKVALAASEAWFRTAGFMQYGKGVGQQGVTAEDVAKQLLQVNIQVNVEK
jgi:hypothetical protein